MPKKEITNFCNYNLSSRWCFLIGEKNCPYQCVDMWEKVRKEIHAAEAGLHPHVISVM